VAGFAAVLGRLRRMERNLNEALEKCPAEVERVHFRLEMLAMAELNSTWENLNCARKIGSASCAADLLKEADRSFQKYRNYYYALAMTLHPLTNVQIPLPQIAELFGRFLACGLAEVEAKLLLGDLDLWRDRHEVLCKQAAESLAGSASEAFSVRADAAGLLTSGELVELKDQAEAIKDYPDENLARIQRSPDEIDWLDRSGLSPRDYLDELASIAEPNVVSIRHD
jgi:hypothetical protein